MARTRTRRLRWTGGLAAAICAAAFSAITLPAHAVPEGRILGAGEPGAVDGSYLVTLRKHTPAPSAAGKSLAERYGVDISHTYGAVLNGYAVRADARRARWLAADPRVASVVQDTRVRLESTGLTQRNPPSWGLDRIDQPGLPLDRGYTSPGSAGAGVTVYVIDTGVRTTHRDFGGRASHGWDFVGNDGVAADANGHGTHVAGTVAGKSHGVAKKARIVSVRVLDAAGGGTTARVIAGIDWVTRHARKPAVANLSLGGFRNAQLDAAVRTSIASGVTYTVAAGNDGRPAGLYSPGSVEQAITVGATDRRDTKPAFSNHGPALDLFAPGVAITSASAASDTAQATYSGTSMASPHAAGAAALYLADHPKATPSQVGRALTTSAATKKISGGGPGSPDKLLRVPGG
ncbi:secreted serine protease [Streptomyces viridochromogenes DSM 40736]|uniref:Secreted serine protease n=1 Tax=Streptomyces viridochromogenes (strain DSM 40736 / JCM 4977 / BCRC 1201 / Tue 494) TaxID=591159 RepID=D9XHF6_STRVT|nr:S8 family peptidase [Streptomyces viridochromogenes]EFL34975.1 secreted serine protease [Streptomyces viridochromogenes DSM 40736]